MNDVSFPKINWSEQLARTFATYRTTFAYSKERHAHLWVCVSIDLFESSSSSCTTKLEGVLTNKRYTIATVIIDHYSDLSYVFMQKRNSSTEVIITKLAFEKIAKSWGTNRTLKLHKERKITTSVISCWGVKSHIRTARRKFVYGTCR